jgi:hypothetical protein|tara:strand:- start:1086 stop:1751 length:666 start_codon:yes stop_codon:yes gene_type:complete
MNKLPNNWLTEMPFDYEFKYYTLLAQVKRLKVCIKDLKLKSTYDEIETGLDQLYDIKYARDGIERNDVRIIGIDVDSMEIKYDYPEDSIDSESMYDLCDVAINLFESLHKKLRSKWRDVSDMLRVSNIGLNSIKNHGFVYLKIDSKLHKYKIFIPIQFKTSWRDVRIEFISIEDYNLKELSKFVNKQEYGVKHIRCDLDSNIPIIECVIPVLKSVLYKNLI